MCDSMEQSAAPRRSPTPSNQAESDANTGPSESYDNDRHLTPVSHTSDERHPHERETTSHVSYHHVPSVGESTLILDGGLSHRLSESRRDGFQNADDFQEDAEFDLEQRIRGAMIPNRVGRFLPVLSLERILTRDNITAKLIKAGVEDASYIADQIWETKDVIHGKTSRQRIFAILCMIGKAKQISGFIEEDIYDHDLPFSFESGPKSDVYREDAAQSRVPIMVFAHETWIESERESFQRYQGELLAPFFIFSHNPTQNLLEYRLKETVVLPFIEDTPQVVNGDLGLTLGGCSFVRKVEIHPSHYNGCHGTQGTRPNYFAVKELHADEGEQTNREVRALKRMNDILDKHLIRLLMVYVHRGRVHLIFPWADGNLQDLWKKTPQPSLQPSRIVQRAKWMAGQMLGLARSLQRIHHCEIPKTHEKDYSDRELQRTYGRHGDIKPQNILWFMHERTSDAQMCTDVLKVADFGFADFRSPHSKSNVRRSAIDGFTETYEAPELLVTNKVSPRYDIWSFGCILLQFAVWYLRGWTGVDNFSKRRANDRRKTLLIPTDNFFLFGLIPDSKLAAQLKQSVLEEFEELKTLDNCSDFILDLLEYVQLNMLRVNPRMRADIESIVQKFEELVRHCDEDSKYCTDRIKAAQRVGSELSEIYEQPESSSDPLISKKLGINSLGTTNILETHRHAEEEVESSERHKLRPDLGPSQVIERYQSDSPEGSELGIKSETFDSQTVSHTIGAMQGETSVPNNEAEAGPGQGKNACAKLPRQTQPSGKSGLITKEEDSTNAAQALLLVRSLRSLATDESDRDTIGRQRRSSTSDDSDPENPMNIPVEARNPDSSGPHTSADDRPEAPGNNGLTSEPTRGTKMHKGKRRERTLKWIRGTTNRLSCNKL